MGSGLERFVLDVIVNVGPVLPGKRGRKVKLVQLLVLDELVDHVVNGDANILFNVYVGFSSAGHVGAVFVFFSVRENAKIFYQFSALSCWFSILKLTSAAGGIGAADNVLEIVLFQDAYGSKIDHSKRR